jgi:CheY-like chemotaxis protein
MALLLVDDDEICIFLTKRIIRYAGVEEDIHTAANGMRALEFIQSTIAEGLPLPSTILLDLNMPVMDGFTFINSFQALKAPGSENVRIIIVSSSVNRSDIDRAERLGIVDFMQKPLDVPMIQKLLFNYDKFA